MKEIEPIKHPDEKLFPKKDKLPLKDFLEIVGKGAVYLSVACYLMGFIVVNAHFNRFGYYSVSLVSALTGRGDTSVSIQSDVIQAVSYQAR